LLDAPDKCCYCAKETCNTAILAQAALPHSMVKFAFLKLLLIEGLGYEPLSITCSYQFSILSTLAHSTNATALECGK
jgi:hypothetical protein